MLTQGELLASFEIFLAILVFCIVSVRPGSLEYWVKTVVAALTLSFLFHEVGNPGERDRWVAGLLLVGQLVVLAYFIGDAHWDRRRVVRLPRRQLEEKK